MPTCPLCLIETPRLRRSHLLPKSAYKRVNTKEEPNPVLITPDAIVKTSAQLVMPLLCGECEQLLSTKGEQYSIPLLASANRIFPLREILKEEKQAIRSEGDGYAIYDGRKLEKLDLSSLAHFVVGLFWRSSQKGWKTFDGIQLGRYEEAFRKYLLTGEFPLDRQSTLLLMVNSDTGPSLEILQPPQTFRIDGAIAHEFRVLGLRAQFRSGYKLARNEATESACFLRNGTLCLASDHEDFLRFFRLMLERVPVKRNQVDRHGGAA